jgi:Kef-type K+ transport system membrane component KefB
VGLVVAGVFLRDRALMHRMRSIAFALLTPFYFIKAVLYVSLPAVATGAVIIVALLAVKLAAQGLGVWPTGALFGFPRWLNAYTTLLMSTGLTFGTISALFGFENHIITQEQYTGSRADRGPPARLLDERPRAAARVPTFSRRRVLLRGG